jgi:transcriptional regulator with XRE-family HTH domain
MSQGEIEEKTGLLRCYISRVENGHTVPAVETLEKFARALEIPMYQLFFDGDKPPTLTPVKSNTPKLSRAAQNHLHKIAVAFEKMDRRNMAIVSALARKIADQ